MTKTLFPDAVITGEMLPHLRLPEIGDRYELVEGHIVPVTPTNFDHAEAMARIATLLIERMPGWHILSGDPGVYVRRRPDTVRGPDVLAISAERCAAREPTAFLTVAPELVIEIVSPSNAEEDIARKVAEYMAIGSTVWVVDLDTETVAVDGVISQTLMLPNGVTLDIAELVG